MIGIANLLRLWSRPKGVSPGKVPEYEVSTTVTLFLSTVVSRFSGLSPSPPKSPLNRDSPLNGINIE